MEKFKSYITEEKDEPYRFVVIYNDPEQVGDDSKEETVPMANKMLAFGKKLGLQGYKSEIDKLYFNGDFIGNAEDKEFKIDKNTVIFNRSRSNDRASWTGLIYHLEHSDALVINTMDVHNICADKFRTFTKLQGIVQQPKVQIINHVDHIEDAFKRLKTSYPVVLKTMLGTGGVGVLKIENESQLLSSVQIIQKLGPERGMIIQEFIPLEYDIRVIMLAGKIHGAMKRPTAEGDFRSNIHQGSKPEKIELTQREIEVCNKVINVIDADWAGIDLIPAKDREKQDPYMLEVNSQPGHVGYDSIGQGSVLEDVLKTYMNRDNWGLDKSI